MIRLAVLRHGATEWNAAKRLQGRADIPLSEAGKAALATRRIPMPYKDRAWFVSPLLRARQTAEALDLRATVATPLIEMDWGAYEGATLAELSARHGAAFDANEARGLDLLPPNGESPRQVQQRLLPWLAGLRTDAGAVTHKGVIRALLSLALDWPMLGKLPVRLDWHCLQEFRITDAGRLELAAVNIPLE